MGADVVIDYTKTSSKPRIDGESENLKSICQTIKEDHGDSYVDIVLDCVGGTEMYYRDVCNNFECKKARDGVAFTTISPNVPFEPNMGLSSLMKIGYFVVSNKIRSLSSAYPSFHFVFMDKNVKDMNLLMNHIVISNQVYNQLPLMEFEFSAQGLNDAHKQMESQRTVGKIVIKIQ
ncbi:predicted protein [Naegleria gruberi]|uniref:Predicted protein n=1 Tax=Naegleria gruberi TaxID=5762 RepID=D2W1S3_NAEGR|nr:uncharacterized protein NAEGRDRAFT_75357 [Naegleria gruberi]EFC36970.1 predicted protein [Naegleria gruberi]|eukprot:XP_002669714.1 predicted protein [Naegleria gruberi strain NEG-M]